MSRIAEFYHHDFWSTADKPTSTDGDVGSCRSNRLRVSFLSAAPLDPSVSVNAARRMAPEIRGLATVRK